MSGGHRRIHIDAAVARPSFCGKSYGRKTQLPARAKPAHARCAEAATKDSTSCVPKTRRPPELETPPSAPAKRGHQENPERSGIGCPTSEKHGLCSKHYPSRNLIYRGSHNRVTAVLYNIEITSADYLQELLCGVHGFRPFRSETAARPQRKAPLNDRRECGRAESYRPRRTDSPRHGD